MVHQIAQLALERVVVTSAHGLATPVFVQEQAELFVALLRRRAQQILEARRPPPPPLVSFSSGIAQGYESNVNLDGEREGDFFTQETFGVVLRPRVTSWLRGEFTYDLFNAHYTELRDANLWTNTFEGTIQIQPHDRVRVDVGYAYRIVDFPFNTSSSYFAGRCWRRVGRRPFVGRLRPPRAEAVRIVRVVRSRRAIV